jgi:glycolate dehydrogenase FAD-linked subunit
MADPVVADLRGGLPPDAVLDDVDVVASYSRDMVMFAPSGRPRVVVLPRTVEEVQHAVRVAARHRVPLVPRGAGSGLAGSSNGVDGGITLVLTRMAEVLEVDPTNRLVVVQPGVVNADLRAAVQAHGLFYPPDPSSYEWCTIGGNLSTNAGGLCCVKYGVTTDFVLGLQVVLADGEVLRTGRRTVKGVAGYDLTRLFVGAEGTLGVITEATLALKPRPQAPVTLVASFPSTAAAGRAVEAVVLAGLVPSLLEIMDQTCIRAVDEWKHMELDRSAAALLIAQSDTGGPRAVEEIGALGGICTDAGAGEVYSTEDLEEGRMLLAARRLALPALEQLGATLIDDVAVPRSRIADLLAGTARIAAEVGLTIGVVGHAGDGNMHPTIILDPTSEEERARAQTAFDAILDLGLRLGGTVTGEHGIGTLKLDWLAREIGPLGLRVHQSIKDALDPLGILNPGKVFGSAPAAGRLSA